MKKKKPTFWYSVTGFHLYTPNNQTCLVRMCQWSIRQGAVWYHIFIRKLVAEHIILLYSSQVIDQIKLLHWHIALNC